MLGYGALGRETARLLKSHGMRVIAANTSGKATTQDGVSHVIPPLDYKTTKGQAGIAGRWWEIEERLTSSISSQGQGIKKG